MRFLGSKGVSWGSTSVDNTHIRTSRSENLVIYLEEQHVSTDR